jgi:hypothetical protein
MDLTDFNPPLNFFWRARAMAAGFVTGADMLVDGGLTAQLGV